MQNPRGREIVSVGISGALARDDPNAAAGRYALRRRFHHRFVHAQSGRREVFKVKVGIVATGRKRGPKIAFKVVLGNAIVLKEKMIIVHGYWMTSRQEGLGLDYPTLAAEFIKPKPYCWLRPHGRCSTFNQSGSRILPSLAISKKGFQATSHRKPSRSEKYPE